MKYICLLFAVITSVAAFSDPGAYERLWYWYAYTLDPSGSKIAVGCAKASGVGKNGRCSFVQFMKYIDLDPNANLIPGKIDGIDTTDVGKTITGLKDGHYTGTYDTSLIHTDIKGKSDVAALMKSVTGFLEGKLPGASAVLKTNLQQVTLGVAVTRQEASIPGYTEQLAALKPPITVKTGQIPAFVDSTDLCEFLDIPATAEASGMKGSAVTAAIRQLNAADEGHFDNIVAAKRGAASCKTACLP